MPSHEFPMLTQYEDSLLVLNPQFSSNAYERRFRMLNMWWILCIDCETTTGIPVFFISPSSDQNANAKVTYELSLVPNQSMIINKWCEFRGSTPISVSGFKIPNLSKIMNQTNTERFLRLTIKLDESIDWKLERFVDFRIQHPVLSNAMLILKDHRFFVSKSILALHSKKFAKLFEKYDVIQIYDKVEPSIVIMVLNMLYMGDMYKPNWQLSVSVEKLRGALEFCNAYKIEYLKTHFGGAQEVDERLKPDFVVVAQDYGLIRDIATVLPYTVKGITQLYKTNRSQLTKETSAYLFDKLINAHPICAYNTPLRLFAPQNAKFVRKKRIPDEKFLKKIVYHETITKHKFRMALSAEEKKILTVYETKIIFTIVEDEGYMGLCIDVDFNENREMDIVDLRMDIDIGGVAQISFDWRFTRFHKMIMLNQIIEWATLELSLEEEELLAFEVMVLPKKLKGAKMRRLMNYSNGDGIRTNAQIFVEQQRFYVSWELLSLHSPVLLNMFQSERRIELHENITADEFYNILDLIYLPDEKPPRRFIHNTEKQKYNSIGRMLNFAKNFQMIYVMDQLGEMLMNLDLEMYEKILMIDKYQVDSFMKKVVTKTYDMEDLLHPELKGVSERMKVILFERVIDIQNGGFGHNHIEVLRNFMRHIHEERRFDPAAMVIDNN